MKALALVLLVACTPAQRTVALASASTALLAVDWHQTRGIVKECAETNPVIGQCGERVSPDTYFPVVALVHLAVGATLPRHWRELWFSTIAGVQGSTTWLNWRRK